MQFVIVPLNELFPRNFGGIKHRRVVTDHHSSGTLGEPSNILLSIGKRRRECAMEHVRFSAAATFHAQQKAALTRRWHGVFQLQKFTVKSL